MNEVKYILEQIRKTKTIVLIIILLAFILFYYKSLVTQVVISKVKPVDEVKKDINNKENDAVKLKDETSYTHEKVKQLQVER